MQQSEFGARYYSQQILENYNLGDEYFSINIVTALYYIYIIYIIYIYIDRFL